MATPHVQADEPSLLERSDSSGITSPEAPAAIDAFPAGKAANQVPILLSGEQPGIPPERVVEDDEDDDLDPRGKGFLAQSGVKKGDKSGKGGDSKKDSKSAQDKDRGKDGKSGSTRR